MSLDLLAQLTVSGIVVGMTYALLGVSFGVIYATTKIFHLAHAVPYAAAAYTAVWAAERLGLGLVPACLLGLAVGTVAGAAIEILAYRPMVGRNATLLSIFLVSLGISVAFPNLLQIVFGPENRALPGFTNPTYELGAVTVSRHDLLTVAVSLVLVAVVVLFIDRTRLGRSITAMRTNPTMASAVGIDRKAVYLLVFGIGSLLVSVAGLLFTLRGVATPTMGLAPVLTAFIAAFLGGIGSLPGAALGGLVLGLVSSWSALFLEVDYGPVVVFGAMFLVLLVRPQGLLGREAV
ncbi:branched-chain amino acid ABC transporter permease [Geodermatophilus sp. DSM 44513]|uniref:branched-chain amino acid ABC transporter permease n=1 Tax=Geodermatophilus sp. DSM 44513 TaxID=1528104 RepID=UPI00126C945D|nr:branched-chain amino acid ABC transporter permease [Geodermatophilus sp. DSM 44513]WNV75081.1 branched-chain amino acid ABC transporter permease [Geodermatophilus sp. DSM 44513]